MSQAEEMIISTMKEMETKTNEPRLMFLVGLKRTETRTVRFRSRWASSSLPYASVIIRATVSPVPADSSRAHRGARQAGCLEQPWQEQQPGHNVTRVEGEAGGRGQPSSWPDEHSHLSDASLRVKQENPTS